MHTAGSPRKFILIDNSITGFAGHYYEYAAHVLTAAAEAGYECWLATNRKFAEGGNCQWHVVPAYKYRFWSLMPPPGWPRSLVALAAGWGRLRFRLRIAARITTPGIAFQFRNCLGPYLAKPPWNVGRIFEAAQLLPIAAGTKIARILALPVLLLLGLLFMIPALIVKLLRSRPFRPMSKALKAGVGRFVVGEIRGIAGLFRSLLASRIEVLRYFKQIVCTRRFASDTRAVFRNIPLEDGDIVFIPTASAVEMMGLGKFLAREPRCGAASWHILYRRDIYRGRAGDYDAQEEGLHELRHLFRAFEKLVNGRSRICYYTDTEELTVQYNRLAAGLFRTLPIPHTHAPDTARVGSRPLRIVYAGDSRSEKGYARLPHLVQDLWVELGDSGVVEFAFQSNFNIPGGEPECVIARAQLDAFPQHLVKLYDEPLTSPEYRELLLSADLNLLLYDPENYYARSSGILVESLSAGIPVLVPAGTWLARQFLSEHYKHLESLCGRLPVIDSVASEDLRWRSEQGSRICSRIAVPPKATHVFLAVDFASAAEQEALITLEELDEELEPVERPAGLLLEAAPGTGKAIAAGTLDPGTAYIRLNLRAGTGASLRAPGLRLHFATASDRPPLSAVGLIYQSPREISRLAMEFIRHYEHYRVTARQFARGYREYHNSRRLVQELNGTVERRILEMVP